MMNDADRLVLACERMKNEIDKSLENELLYDMLWRFWIFYYALRCLLSFLKGITRRIFEKKLEWN